MQCRSKRSECAIGDNFDSSDGKSILKLAQRGAVTDQLTGILTWSMDGFVDTKFGRA